MRQLLIALTLSIATVAPAAAQDRGTSSPETTTYVFGDDFVTGDTESPMIDLIGSRVRSRRETLIRARAHWIPELARSLENL